MFFNEIPDSEITGFASKSGLFYEFSDFVVLLHGGTYYWSSDSGCSCPSPFESHQFPDDFGSGNAVQALNALDEWSQGTPVDDDGLRTRLISARA
jgi:hypothetical protein